MATYQVKSGDTLSKIAAANKTTVGALASLNNIADVNKINVGQNLNLGGVQAPVSSPQFPSLTNQATQNKPITLGTNQTSTPATTSRSTFGGYPSAFLSDAGNAITGAFNYATKGSYDPVFNPNGVGKPTTIYNPDYTTPSATTAPALHTTPVNSTVDASAVNNTKPLVVPQSNVDTTHTALGAAVDSSFQQYGNTQNQNNAITAIQQGNQSQSDPTQNSNNSDITTRIAEQFGVDPNAILAKLAGKTAETNTLNDQFKVPEKIQDATDAYNQYNQQKVALQQQIEKIYNTPGLTREQAEQQVNEVQRAGNANLANLAVISESAQGNLQAAQNIVKMKLDAEFQPLQDQIDAIGKFTQINNADLTDSEKTQLENQRFVLQNNLDQLKSAKENAHQFALQQGIQDPNLLNAIDQAKSPSEVYSLFGGQAAISQIGNQSISNTNVQSLSQTAQNYVDTASDGTPYVSQDRLQNMTPYQKQQISNEYANAGIRILDQKEVDTLGTIDEAGQNIKLFENAANQLLSPGLFGRIKGFTTNQLSQWTQIDPTWRQFQALRAGLIKGVQGVAAGAPGLRVTGAELANAAEALPNSADNLESSQQAIKTFQQLLDINKNILLRNNKSVGNSSNSSGGWASLGD